MITKDKTPQRSICARTISTSGKQEDRQHQTTTNTITSRQGNNEEQAHTKNKGTNEHDWKKTAIFLKTNINT
jgi:hypothetical protein